MNVRNIRSCPKCRSMWIEQYFSKLGRFNRVFIFKHLHVGVSIKKRSKPVKIDIDI